MQKSRYFKIFLPVMGLMMILSPFVFGRTPPANAQCGSQASSCKNCHEVQGKMPVNNDGTGWHESHAFGDFCYICHAGNSQATDEQEAHLGMVAPLSDVKASCQQCHMNDLTERAQVYAETLGVTLGEGEDSSLETSSEVSTENPSPVNAEMKTSSEKSSAEVMNSAELVINDPNVIDYVERYDEIVLGHHPVNKGNIILLVLIGLIALGGGGFVMYNEGWFTLPEETVTSAAGNYSEDILALLPKIDRLSDEGRRALMKLLENPKDASKLFEIIVRQRK